MSYNRDDREYGAGYDGGRRGEGDSYYRGGNDSSDYPRRPAGGYRQDESRYEDDNSGPGARRDRGDRDDRVLGGYDPDQPRRRPDDDRYGGPPGGRYGEEGNYGGRPQGDRDYGGEERRHRRDDDDYDGRPGGFNDRPPRRNDDYGYTGGDSGQNNRLNRRHDDDSYSEGPSGGRRYGGGSGYPSTSGDDDFNQAAQNAAQGRPQDSNLFSSAMSFLSSNKQNIRDEDVDEGRISRSHQQLYGQGGAGQQHTSDSIGAGAAMQVSGNHLVVSHD